MSPWLVVAVVWLLLAVGIALMIGLGIRLADEIDEACSTYDVELPDGAR